MLFITAVQGSDQFMNWIGIDNQFNSIQHELNWNWIERFWIGIELELKAWTGRNWSIQSIHFQLGLSALAVPEQLSNGGGENVGHSPAESGTDFCAPPTPPCGH